MLVGLNFPTVLTCFSRLEELRQHFIQHVFTSPQGWRKVNPTAKSLDDEEVKEFQLKLEAILKEFLEQGSIEVYGNLRIVVTSFNRPSRIAFQKGNTIYVSIKARGYPDSVLRYIIAHELAHLAVKKHTWRF
jgi:hypothetical protein